MLFFFFKCISWCKYVSRNERRTSWNLMCPFEFTLDNGKGLESWKVMAFYGIYLHQGTRGVHVSGYITHFQQINMNCFQVFTIGLAMYSHTTQQSSGKGSRANEGQIYVHYRRNLSCFPYGDGFAATSKLPHNVGLNRSPITSFSLWKLELYKVFTVLTSLLAPFSVDTVYLLLAVAQIT